MQQVFKGAVCLQNFELQLYGQADHQFDIYGQARIVLGSGSSGQLKDPKLEDMLCRTLDLEAATCLTGISLTGIDSDCIPGELMLPSSVV